MIGKFLCAVVTRSLFLLISLIGIWRVVWVKNNSLYWLLTILYLPLVFEMILTLKSRNGQDYKWFSPAIFLFLISIIPSIWILELHHQVNKASEVNCKKLVSPENINLMKDVWSGNGTNSSEARFQGSVSLLSSVCANDWILALHQILLVLLIIGKWLLPLGGGVTREELSHLLLIFVGTAADILEFTSETLSDVKDNSPNMVYIILAVWTLNLVQFPLHLSVTTVRTADGSDEVQKVPVLVRLKNDILSMVECVFIQDGPFLVVRLVVILHFSVIHQMLIFFSIKNFLVVILNVYRLTVTCFNFKASR